jgi:hypothetical protein
MALSLDGRGDVRSVIGVTILSDPPSVRESRRPHAARNSLTWRSVRFTATRHAACSAMELLEGETCSIG